MTQSEPATRFVVEQLNWERDYGENFARQPGERAVGSFTTAEEAHAECAKRETEARKTVNPFKCGTAVHYWTHLDEPRLRDWLMDHGINPPDPETNGKTDWAAWWKKSNKKLSAEKRAAVWEVLDKVRFFAVREEPVRPVGYAVLEINWEYNDQNYSADTEGGRLFKVYRTRERAEAECARQNKKARKEWSYIDALPGAEELPEVPDDDDISAFDMQARLMRQRGVTDYKELKGEGLFNRSSQIVFFEVIEVALENLE